MTLDQAILEFADTLDRAPSAPRWAEMVRVRLAAVREALAEKPPRFRDGWLSARTATTDTDRRRLLDRLSSLGPRLVEHPEAETSLRELRRLGRDLEHYRQRLHDLVFDDVELELGGSE